MAKSSKIRMSRSGREAATFTEIRNETRVECAWSAWGRARCASGLRHEAVRAGRGAAAKFFGSQKVTAVQRAIELAPELFRLSIDDEYQVGLVSAQAADGSRLHLPAASELTSPPSKVGGRA